MLSSLVLSNSHSTQQSHNTPIPLPHQTRQSCLHVFILLYFLQSDIITLVAAVASAAAVAAAEMGGGGGGGGGGGDCGGGGGGGGDDLTRFELRNLNFFLNIVFHNSLEIIFSNFINSFLTSVISLQATFGI